MLSISLGTERMQKLDTKKNIRKETKGDKVYREHVSGFTVITPKKLLKPIPVCCPVCKFVMNHALDDDTFGKFKCCHDCRVRYADTKAQAWSDGWRPSREDLKKSNNMRNSVPISLRMGDI